MHITTKDRAMDGLKDAFYVLSNQPQKEAREWQVINTIGLALEELNAIQADNPRQDRNPEID